MSDENNLETNEEQPQPLEEETASPSRFPEMDELQSEIDRRIRDNQKFLDHFMDNDYIEEEDEDDEDDDEVFEEL